MNGISYPVQLQDLEIFEENNENVSVNIWNYENDDLKLIRTSEKHDRHDFIFLLLLTEWVKVNGEKVKKEHYVYIKCLKHLYQSGCTKNNKKTEICENPSCSKKMTKTEKAKHQCGINQLSEFNQNISYPDEGTKIIVDDKIRRRKLMNPFTVYMQILKHY